MDRSPKNKWSFWIDRGGTFTDIVAQRPDGMIVTHKLLSENTEQYEDAALHGIRELMGLQKKEGIPAADISEVKMGTTVGTNALLERKGVPVLLVVTKGFRDALRIGYQNRPKLFDLRIKLPEMLYQEVLEVEERINSDGERLVRPDYNMVKADLERAYTKGIRSVAILFMHGYYFSEHEKQVAQIAHDVGFDHVSTSHAVSPLIKFVSRGDTTMVDAYLTPVLKRYVGHVASELHNTRLFFMKSDGGLTDARLFAGKDCILSGPAGGVVGAARISELAGFDKIVGFDMGGTSTDVCHYNGQLERTYETEVAGVRMRAPMMCIHTVAAGGGSIIHFDGSRFRVGPESAGANPGPACYRKGGPLTVTDCNVMTGKILPEYFPAIFGTENNLPLDREGVADKFSALTKDIYNSTHNKRTPEEVADGFLAIAVENMANAIKKISVQRGYDVSRYTLVCFGGAGGQHACLVADSLGMRKVLVHPYAGVLSAFGMGLADLSATAEKAVERVLNPDLMPILEKNWKELEHQAKAEIVSQGILKERVHVYHNAQIKYKGSDTTISVKQSSENEMRSAFEQTHKQHFGFVDQEKDLIVEALIVEAIGSNKQGDSAPEVDTHIQENSARKLTKITRLFSCGDWHEGPVVDRQMMQIGPELKGPAIIIEPHGTIVVEKGWQAELTERFDIVLSRVVEKEMTHAIGTTVDPVMLEIFNNLYMSIAEQMGTVLANTAQSVNIKERLDFSCAIFDQRGNLVANAPHVPVHLGSMSESVKAIHAGNLNSKEPGDVFAVNAPYNGGTHLPDLTVVTPVFDEPSNDVLFYVASRGHHADIGGLTPGSMPPHSVNVDEEGILFDNYKLIEKGNFLEKDLRKKLCMGNYPARNPDQNIADLKAQIAANEMGIRELRKMIGYFGLDVVQSYMEHVQNNAEEAVRRVIDVLENSENIYEMDNGAKIQVSIQVDRKSRSATIDFTGTSEQLHSNYNAPSAVCKAVILYVFRCLVNDAIPLNAGCLKPLEIIIPKGCMLNPCYPAAVVAGNVETSQCIADALFGAMKIVAGSQGTMNNFTFGNDQWQYYETIAGGAGAGPDFDGASAVQTHMTNSRLTDPEVLENRFPIMLEEFSIRGKSGGEGHFRGGDGVERRLRFLEEMNASILSNNRNHAPKGLAGGMDGQSGENRVVRADGREEVVDSAGSVSVKPGDVFVVKTPGGGGYGKA